MPIHKIVSTATRVQIWIDPSAPSSDLDIVQLLIDQGGAGNEDKVALVIKDLIQADLDVVQARKTLSNDDPDKVTNPNRPDLFWRGDDLVGRGVIVESVVWDGTRYVPTLRRAR